jgi:hypothetical protein
MKTRLALVAAVVLATALSAHAQTASDRDQALATFKELATANPNFGFDSQSEIDYLRLGEPFTVKFVGLADLRGWNSGDDANALLLDPHTVMYPVLSGTTVAARIELTNAHGKWELASAERSATIKTSAIANAAYLLRDQLIKSTGLAADQFFLVEIPALHTYMLGYKVGSQVFLAPLFDKDPHGHGNTLKAGKVMKAETVFDILKPEAKTLDTSAPG